MQATEYAKGQIQQVFKIFGGVLDDMTEEQYNWSPGGTANTAAKSHVHLVSTMDLFVNGILQGKKPGWPAIAEANGLPQNALEVWGSDSPIPMAPLREYAASVQQQVMDYIDTLNDDDLDREVDTKFFGKKTVAFVLQLCATHMGGHMGDISAVKGMQGLKGLPF